MARIAANMPFCLCAALGWQVCSDMEQVTYLTEYP